jgi:large subunit ribosomal protein L6
MSRIGKNPVSLPSGVSVDLGAADLTVKGVKGTLSMAILDDVLVSQQEDGAIKVAPRDESKRARSMWGLHRSLIANMVTGVSEGFTKDLEIIGVGYRAQVQDQKLILQLGFSKDVEYDIPEDIEVSCERPTMIKIEGIDKQRVGQAAAEIRRFRPPEPYKGKGIRYVGEYVLRKEGKKK